jgi:predicted kinase
MDEKTLVLLRGIPGSGKSTFSKTIGGLHFEADNYFMIDDVYEFISSKIKDAHRYCQESVEVYMMRGEEKIVVSNTFTQEWEMEPYFEMATQYGYKVFSIIVENRHGNVNLHNVPTEKLESMRNRFQIKL